MTLIGVCPHGVRGFKLSELATASAVHVLGGILWVTRAARAAADGRPDDEGPSVGPTPKQTAQMTGRSKPKGTIDAAEQASRM